MAAEQVEEKLGLQSLASASGACEQPACAVMTAPPSIVSMVNASDTKGGSSGIVSGDEGKHPGVNHTPAVGKLQKRARVVSPPSSTGVSPARKGAPLYRRRLASAPAGQLWQHPPATTGLSTQHSMFSSDTPMAPPATLQTINYSSSVPFTPVATSLGYTQATTNPPASVQTEIENGGMLQQFTARTNLTPPRLIFPAYAVQDAPSPQSVAAALDKILSVSEKPASARPLPSPAPCSLTHIHDSAPTPCSTPSKPCALPPAPSSALATTTAGASARQGCNSMHDMARGATSTAAPPLSRGTLTPSASSHLPVFSASVPASSPRPEMQTSEPCPVETSFNSVAVTGILSDIVAAVSGATTDFQQPALPNDLHAVGTAAKSLMSATLAPEQDILPRSASLPQLCRSPSPALAAASPASPTVLGNGSDSELACKQPHSPLFPLSYMHEECMTQDAGHTPHRILKPGSVSPSDENKRNGGTFTVEPLSLPLLEKHDAIMDCRGGDHSSRQLMDRSWSTSPAPRASEDEAVGNLTADCNMHHGATEADGLQRSLSNMKICGSVTGDEFMSPDKLLTSHGILSPHEDPISSPSHWDTEDPLSIYKPENLVFMPSGPSRRFLRTSTSAAGTELPMSTNAVDSITRDMELFTTASDPGRLVPESRDDAWCPWQLPHQVQGVGSLEHDSDRMEVFDRSLPGLPDVPLVRTSNVTQVAGTGFASAILSRSAFTFSASVDRKLHLRMDRRCNSDLCEAETLFGSEYDHLDSEEFPSSGFWQ